MSELMAAWRAKKAAEADQLHDLVAAAIRSGRVDLFSDPRVLDYQGSPVHSQWDHLTPLLLLMSLAMVILLSLGVAFGIVAMTVCVLVHLLGNKYFVAWRLRQRTTAYMLESALHWQQVWAIGGVALVLKDTRETPCIAPKGDWRKFVRRNLPDDDGQTMLADDGAAPDAVG